MENVNQKKKTLKVNGKYKWGVGGEALEALLSSSIMECFG